MKGNSSTLLYYLVILHGFCAAVQGVQFPIEIEGFKYEAGNVPATLYDNHDSKVIWLVPSRSTPDWFDLWISTSPRHQRLLTFKIVEIYSMVVNVLSLFCNSTFPSNVMNVQMHFISKDDMKSFRYDEIFLKRTNILSSREFGHVTKTGLILAPWQLDYFDYELCDVLLYNGGEAKRVAQDVILDRILIKNASHVIVSQFYIRSLKDNLIRFTDVMFLEGFFNVSPVEVDRIVLGIWANTDVTYHICLVFAETTEALDFHESISYYTQPTINIDKERTKVLFSADLTEVKTIQ